MRSSPEPLPESGKPVLCFLPRKEHIVSDALVELIDLVPTILDAAKIEIPYWVQGRSLTGILEGLKLKHREFVRTEFFDAINYPDQTHATMYRDSKWKFISYHGKDLCESYDLENDPWEHNDLSECSDHQFVLMNLMQKSFDAAIRATPPDAPRNMPF